MKIGAVGQRGIDMGLSDRAGHLETRGIEFIPPADRHGKPVDVLLVFFSAQLTFGSIVIGAIPIAFGLTVWQAISAIVAGSLVGSLAVAAMALMGPRSGTNSVVSSGAFFGIRGRHIGSTIIEVIDLGYFGMCMWVCAPQLVQLLHLTIGLPDGRASRTGSIIVCALIMLAIGLLGHATIVAYQKYLSSISLVTLVIIAVGCCLNPTGHPLSPGHFQHGSVWASWALSVSMLIANAISFAPFAGDYARYLPAATSSAQLFGATLLGMFAGCAVGLSVGLVVALHVADPLNCTTEMLTSLPLWLLVPVSLMALSSNLSSGGMIVYNGILSLHAALFRLSRIQVAYLFGCIGIALGYFGLIAHNLPDSIGALCSVVTMLVTPWIVINVVGYYRLRGHFDVLGLQRFVNPSGSSYWYFHGFNPAAVFSWLAAVIVGLPFAANDVFIGPVAAYFHGVDSSVIVSAFVSALIYSLFDQAPQLIGARSPDGDNVSVIRITPS